MGQIDIIQEAGKGFEHLRGDDLYYTSEDYKRVKARCQGGTLLRILRDWFPDGKHSGNYFRVGSLDGEPGNSLRVHLEIGVFEDPADADCEGGDIIDLNRQRLARVEMREVSKADALLDLIRTLDDLGAPNAPVAVAPVPSYRPIMPIPKEHWLPMKGKIHTNQGLMPPFEAAYIYRDADGNHLMYRFRCKDAKGCKYFLPLTMDPDGRTFNRKDCPAPRPLYGLDVIAARPDNYVLIVEGEKTADAAAKLFSDYAVVTWPGGSDGVPHADFSPLAGRDCVIWPDADAPGREAATAVRNRLMLLGCNVRIVETEGLPEKWDLADEVPDGVDICAHLESATAPAAPENRFQEPGPRRDLTKIEDLWEALEELNRRHFTVFEAGKCRIWTPEFDEEMKRWRHSVSSFDDIRNQYLTFAYPNPEPKEKKPVRLGHVWVSWKNRRSYYRAVFVVHGEVPPNHYNLWRGFMVEPQKGDWSKMQAHVRDVVCSSRPERFEYVMGWMATLLQHPESQSEVALVLRGKKGTGKTKMAMPLIRILGQHALHIHNQKFITGNFNLHLRDAVFVVGDEAFWAGDKKEEGVLKGLITDPMLVIEGKGQNAISAKNRIKLLLISNEEWVVPATIDERRYCVFEVSDERRLDFEYFAEIDAELENGGYEAMLYDLLNYDLSHFNIRDLPHTEELMEQALHTLGNDAFKSWWFSKLKDGALMPDQETWTEPVVVDRLFSDYVRQAGNSGVQRRAMSTQFGIRLTKMCGKGRPKKFERRVEETEGEGDQAKTRKVRRWFYQFPPLEECRKIFDASTKRKIDWSEGVADEESM